MQAKGKTQFQYNCNGPKGYIILIAKEIKHKGKHRNVTWMVP